MTGGLLSYSWESLQGIILAVKLKINSGLERGIRNGVVVVQLLGCVRLFVTPMCGTSVILKFHGEWMLFRKKYLKRFLEGQ